jgi:hypothetical protein
MTRERVRSLLSRVADGSLTPVLALIATVARA